MISASTATIIILCFMGIFGILLPILDKTPIVRQFVSFRWAIIVVFLAILLGTLLDFSHLSDGFRISVAVGVMILGGLYIVIRSYEKVLANGWSLGIDRVKVEKGDLKAEVDLADTPKDKDAKEGV